MTSLGLRLKLLALLVISLLLIAMGVLLVANPISFGDSRFHRIALFFLMMFVGIDALGRVLCAAAPVGTPTRYCVLISIGCQLAAVVFIVAPFILDRELDFVGWLVQGIGPAFLLQVGAAILFMTLTRNVFQIIGRPDLATMPKWVLAGFGIGGTSLTSFVPGLVLLVLIATCCGAPLSLGGLFVYVWK